MSKLNEIPDKNPFKVPENYFEEFNRRIINSTSGLPSNVKKVGLYDRFKPYLLIAASVTILVFLSFAAIKLFAPGKNQLQLSEVINSEFSESVINEFDLSTLEENAAALVMTDEVPNVSKSDIIDCLLQENIEISDIYERL
jgi:hypothetical protein